MFGLDVWGVHSFCSISETFRLVFYLLIYFSCGVVCSVYGALGWDRCGIHSICSAYETFGLVRFHGPFRVSGDLGQGPLWHSQHLYRLGSVGVGHFCGFHSI